jgi:exonuclease SbcD
VKILHTADWHVGRTLRGRSRAEEHRAVLEEIADIAADEGVDVVLVCGDLFDTAAPTPEAERIVYQALLDLARTGASVVVIAGNHDNPRRLQAVEPLLDLGRVITRPLFRSPAEGGVLEIASRAGDETAQVAVVPFLSQRHVIRAEQLLDPDLDAAAHHQTYDARLRSLVEALCAGVGPDTVNLVAAHLTAAGGLLGGGDRAAHTGFAYEVGSHAFPASAHYVALGHLHRSQAVPGPCPIHYSGSPLQLDFGEVHDTKAVMVVEAHPGAPAEVHPVELRSGRRLRTIRGTFAELEPLAGSTEDDYLKIIVREAPRVGLADDVRQLFPEAVDVVIERPDGPAGVDGRVRRVERHGRKPTELFADYLGEQGIDDPALLGLFADVLEEVAG